MTDASVPTLRYISDEEPGIRRRRAGRGFVYVDAAGRTVRDPASLERIRAIVIPPAWTDVWIAPDPNGHIQATGRDARGRKQYRYHPGWRALRDELKFEHLLEFGTVLPAIRRRVDRDMARPDVARERVIATVVRLLELSLIRVGNEEYARDNQSYGLTTLRARHAHVNGTRLEFAFRGKSGREHRTSVTDRRVARAVARLQELPGQLLFQYVDAEQELHPVGSADVNEYLRETSGADVTAKDYRTWMGSVLTATSLAASPPPKNVTAARARERDVICEVSAALGNTPAVCRASYVHPRIIDAFESGVLAEAWNAASTRGSRLLVADERRLLSFLRSGRSGWRRRTRVEGDAPAARARAAGFGETRRG